MASIPALPSKAATGVGLDRREAQPAPVIVTEQELHRAAAEQAVGVEDDDHGGSPGPSSSR